MNTKCHQFPLDQIISGDRCVSVGGRGVLYMHNPLLPSPPHTSLPQITWLCVQFPSVGRRQVHLILFQVLLQISDRLLDRGFQVYSKPNGTLCNVKSLESQLIFSFKKFCFPCSFLKSIIRGKLAGVERKRKYPSGYWIQLLLWWLGRRDSDNEGNEYNLSLGLSIKRWQPAIQEYLTNIYQGVWVISKLQLLRRDAWIHFLSAWLLSSPSSKLSSEACLKAKHPLTGVSGETFFASSFNVLSFALEKNPRVLVVWPSEYRSEVWEQKRFS